jgi:hypothetical protein
MRTVQRIAATAALGLSVLLVGPGVAMACDKHSANIDYQPVFMIDYGGGEQEAAVSSTQGDD